MQNKIRLPMTAKTTLLLLCLSLSTSLHAKKEVVVDLTTQKAYAMDNNKIVFEGYISSGEEGRETPTGTFKISEKKVKHKSNLWPKPNGGAMMPLMQRLGDTPFAMHLGELPGAAASHGCIRLQDGFAQKMFRWTTIGMDVTVKGDASLFIPSVETHRHGIKSFVVRKRVVKNDVPARHIKKKKPMYMEDFSFLSL